MILKTHSETERTTTSSVVLQARSSHEYNQRTLVNLDQLFTSPMFITLKELPWVLRVDTDLIVEFRFCHPAEKVNLL